MIAKTQKISNIILFVVGSIIAAFVFFHFHLHTYLPGVELAVGYGLTAGLVIVQLATEPAYKAAHGENATARKNLLLGGLVLVQVLATAFAMGQSTITMVRDLEIFAFLVYAFLARQTNKATPQTEF